MTPQNDKRPEARGARQSRRSARLPAVTSGDPVVTDGAMQAKVWRGLVVAVPLLGLISAGNVVSHLQSAAVAGRRLAPWEPVTWEATSAVAVLGACGVIVLALRIAPPRRGRWALFLAVHLLAAMVFSAVHVLGMWGLRMVVYAAVGGHYRAPVREIAFELRKDLLSYLGLATVFWLAPRVRVASGPGREASRPPRVESFDILEGTRLLRAPVREILAVRAAGNYVEILLDDGRRPLMRASLGEVEVTLAASGFLRTHRSWIVNPERVRALEPSGSGDYRVTLDGGETALVSRRFPQALERLRGGP